MYFNSHVQSGPKRQNTALYDCVIIDLTPLNFIYLYCSWRNMCVRVCFLNNIIIFVVLFHKTAKLLLSIMIWVEETKDSLILATSLCKNKI